MSTYLFARRVNYDRICTDCGFHRHDKKNGLDMCRRPVSLVDGKPLSVQCVSARAVNGVCGPDGRHFSDAAAVRREAAE